MAQKACRRRRAGSSGYRARAGARARAGRGAGSRRRCRPLREVRAADCCRRQRGGLLGLGRGRSRALVRTRRPLSGAGSPCLAGAGQGRWLAGRGRAGDGRRLTARCGGSTHSWRSEFAAGAATSLVGARGRRCEPLDAALRSGRGREVLRARRAGLGTPAARWDVPPVEHGSWSCLRSRRRSAVHHHAGAVGGGRRGDPSGVPGHVLGRHGDAAGG